MKLQYIKLIYLFVFLTIVSVFNAYGRTSNSSNTLDGSLYINNLQILDTIKNKKLVDSTEMQEDIPAPESDANFITKRDTTKKKKSNFVDEIVKTKNQDSMVLDLKANNIIMYNKAEVDYVRNTLKDADIIKIDLETNNIFAKGKIDTLDSLYKKVIFKDRETEYKLDSIAYNLKTEKGKIYGVFFEEAEGYVHGETVKKIGETMNVKKGKYTTCDLEHPHFYLASKKAQYITKGEKKTIVIGPSYVVVEDVPIPLVIPFGFLPVMSERSSGIVLPTFGEENLKGFYLRDGGYYQVINDYMDVALLGGIYTLGSWNAALKTNYAVRYKFNGSMSFDFSRDKFGDKGDKNFRDMKNYKLMWTHTQDPKFRPGSSFSASVNFATSGYNKFDGTLEDYTSTQTNSSIAYSKTWMGTPFSFSTNVQQSQNNQDSTVVLSLPNFVFNVSKIYPFKRRIVVGKQRWYEKISFSYTTTFNNTINMKEKDLFSSTMFDNMRMGMNHSIPVQTSFNLFKFINISPSFNYTERWYFDKIEREWNPDLNRVEIDTMKGFYRVYDYNASVSLGTTLYGMYTFKKDSKVQAIRHMMKPSFGFSYRPNFGAPSYGYYKTVQVDEDGTLQQYSPYERGIYGVPGNNASASMSFTLNNTLEMKVRSDRDSTGIKKVKILESLNLGTSYNFLADSLNLAPISISARTTLFKSMGIDFSMSWDLYKYTDEGRRTKDFAWSHGSAGRVTNLSLGFGYSFRSILGYQDSGTGSGALQPTATEPLQGTGVMGAPSRREQLLANAIRNVSYYNFSVPWNLSFNYMFQFSNTGRDSKIIQTLSFNGGVNLTPKWAVTFSGGVDLAEMKLTPGVIAVVRDLHCWQMSISWVPIGFRKSWNFNISVKSSVLQDLKLKKSSSFMDNYYN